MDEKELPNDAVCTSVRGANEPPTFDEDDEAADDNVEEGLEAFAFATDLSSSSGSISTQNDMWSSDPSRSTRMSSERLQYARIPFLYWSGTSSV